MSPDLINGLFELVGGCLLWRNVLQLHRDKVVRGVHWAPTLFFASWGYWNCFFYPHLDQWWSFVGGLNIVIPNTVWFLQMVHYRKNR